jgi:hypothetical protein
MLWLIITVMPPNTREGTCVIMIKKMHFSFIIHFTSTLILLAASEGRCMLNTACCIYSNCLLIMNSYPFRNRQRINYWNKLRKKRVSFWFLISKYITKHGPQNVKKCMKVLRKKLEETETEECSGWKWRRISIPNKTAKLYRFRQFTGHCGS